MKTKVKILHLGWLFGTTGVKNTIADPGLHNKNIEKNDHENTTTTTTSKYKHLNKQSTVVLSIHPSIHPIEREREQHKRHRHEMRFSISNDWLNCHFPVIQTSLLESFFT
jgi:hypothetical protein